MRKSGRRDKVSVKYLLSAKDDEGSEILYYSSVITSS